MKAILYLDQNYVSHLTKARLAIKVTNHYGDEVLKVFGCSRRFDKWTSHSILISKIIN